jgi:cobalamin biosynthesis protein CobD/CbiB
MALLAALVMDPVVGEPSPPVHPVVWMGRRALDAAEHRAPRSARLQLWYGIGVAIGLPLVWEGLGWLLESCLVAAVDGLRRG